VNAYTVGYGGELRSGVHKKHR